MPDISEVLTTRLQYLNDEIAKIHQLQRLMQDPTIMRLFRQMTSDGSDIGDHPFTRNGATVTVLAIAREFAKDGKQFTTSMILEALRKRKFNVKSVKPTHTVLSAIQRLINSHGEPIRIVRRGHGKISNLYEYYGPTAKTMKAPVDERPKDEGEVSPA